jgi:hypothetical protein
MGTRERVEELRAAYKAKGWNAKKITVKRRPCTYSSEIVVTIRSLEVPYKEAKEMLEEHRSVRYCEMSGETLLGGNTYTNIEYVRELREPLEKVWEAEIAKLAVGEAVTLEGVEVRRETENEYCLLRWVEEEWEGKKHLSGKRIGHNVHWWGASGAAEGIFAAKYKMLGET